MKSRSQLVLFMLSSFSLFLQMQQGLDMIVGLVQKLITMIVTYCIIIIIFLLIIISGLQL
jgi:hypothetical protein